MKQVPVDAMTARAIYSIARFQFGEKFGQWLLDRVGDMKVERSRKTGKIRYIYHGGQLILVARPTDGYFSPSIAGAVILQEVDGDPMENGLKVLSDVADFIKDGKNVFAKHVVDPAATIRPLQEVYLCSEGGDLLAVGKTVLSGLDIAAVGRGVAVKTRHGVNKKKP
ncbi:MAG: PUA domain-containing protein [Promethearchaeota archaeon]